MIDWPSILAEHGAAVWRTVYRLLNHHADALDCYQDTFVAALRFTERQAVDSWGPFLTSLATRRAMDRLRSRYRERSRLVAVDGVLEPSILTDCPLQNALAAEMLEQVRQGLANLPDKQAEVFLLSCIERLSHQQIADRLQIALGEVRVLLHRARTRLRAILEANPTAERGMQ